MKNQFRHLIHTGLTRASRLNIFSSSIPEVTEQKKQVVIPSETQEKIARLKALALKQCETNQSVIKENHDQSFFAILSEEEKSVFLSLKQSQERLATHRNRLSYLNMLHEQINKIPNPKEVHDHCRNEINLIAGDFLKDKQITFKPT